MAVDGLFLLRARRDATISIAGTLWEAPPACRGRIADVHYDLFRHHGYRLHPNGQAEFRHKRNFFCPLRLRGAFPPSIHPLPSAPAAKIAIADQQHIRLDNSLRMR
jgi:hypothetical protein